jgi:hypothetical protein
MMSDAQHPLFRAPPGAIIVAPSPASLLAAMHTAELAAGIPPPRAARSLPHPGHAAAARASSTEMIQAACSWAIRAGEADRSIAPVDGPAPLIADFASFSAVSDPIHRQ